MEINKIRMPLDRNKSEGKPERYTGLIHELVRNKSLFLMLLPGLFLLLVNNYMPMFGVIIAFKDFTYSKGGFISSLFASKWVGFKNFEYFLKGYAAFEVTRNTILYNLVFIFLGLVISVAFAIALNEIRSRWLMKIYQNVMFLPYFLSWLVVSYLVYSFISPEYGLINSAILKPLHIAPLDWYQNQKPWPVLLVLVHIWKGTGYGSVMYLAAIAGINSDYYEAAQIDGASKWQQIWKITIPLLTPLMITLTILAVGKIFYSDFGLFFQVTRNSGMLYSVTQTIDTYVYNSLLTLGDVGMSSAAGLYQSFVGFLLVLITNLIVRKIDKENALF